MRIAMLADPHLSDLDIEHYGINLGDTIRTTEALIDHINRQSLDMVIWLGDLTHDGTAAVRQRFAELHRRLTVTSLPLFGNHDVQLIGKTAFASQTVPCARRQLWHMAGWSVALLDTVKESSPDDSRGELSESDLRLLHDAASQAAGPLLVMGHHPLLRPGDLNVDEFWEAVEPLAGPGVYIGAHTHNDRHDTERGWHVFELASCCASPAGYHIIEIAADGLSITPIRVQVAGIKAVEPETHDSSDVFPATVRFDVAASPSERLPLTGGPACPNSGS